MTISTTTLSTSLRAGLLALAATLAGCHTFTLEVPEDFVALDEPSSSDYAVRTTNADGVVLAVREVDNDRHGTLAFWRKAIDNRVRAVNGYALISDEEVHAATGEPGRRLCFGRDESNQTFAYELTVFVTKPDATSGGHVLVVEAGGKKADFDLAAGKVHEAIAKLELE
jgi:hypothetical protein